MRFLHNWHLYLDVGPLDVGQDVQLKIIEETVHILNHNAILHVDVEKTNTFPTAAIIFCQEERITVPWYY